MISPQGLSKAIKELEIELGVKLFQKKNYTFEPTEEAKELLPHALNVVNEFNLIQDRNMFGNRKITIYTIDAVMDYFALDFLSAFYAEFPNISLKIIETSNQEAIDHVQNRKGELAILQHECEAADFNNEFLFECPFCFVVNNKNPLVKYKSISLRDNASLLNEQKMAGRGFEYVLYRKLYRILADNGAEPQNIMESNNERLLLSLAENNQAIACVSEQVAKANRTDNTSICMIKEKEIQDKIYLSYKANVQLSREAKLFCDFLKKWFSRDKIN